MNSNIQLWTLLILSYKKFDINTDKIIFDETKPRGQFKKTAKSDVPKDYRYIQSSNKVLTKPLTGLLKIMK
jgi:hypothetical protein